MGRREAVALGKILLEKQMEDGKNKKRGVEDLGSSLYRKVRDESGSVRSHEKRPALIKVHWDDIVETCDWTEAEDVKLPRFVTIGWLITENERCLKVGHTMNEDGRIYGITAFPKGCIAHIDYLTQG